MKKNIRSEILNRILSLLLMQENPTFNSISNNGNESEFIDLNEIIALIPDYDIEDWMLKEFKKELLFKKYIDENYSGLVKISETGKEFIRKGGYRSADKKEHEEETIREKTIESFKYGEYGFYISIIALIVSVIALIWK